MRCCSIAWVPLLLDLRSGRGDEFLASPGLSLLIPLLLVLLTGCGQSSTSDARGAHPTHAAAGVAVIDLDAVAKALGRDVQMNNAIQQQQQSLERQLEQYQIELKGRFAEHQQALEQNATGSQDQADPQSTLQALDQQLGAQLTAAVGNARETLTAQRLRLIQQFRDEVQPVARKVAMERGCNVVVTKNDTVIFDHSPAADISAEVARRMDLSAGDGQATKAETGG